MYDIEDHRVFWQDEFEQRFTGPEDDDCSNPDDEGDNGH